ncbi:MAG: lysophospholipid acyltransferase family protein [Candidatus Palauibacterales bacterium]|nr:lysophospholipid acyltransferase family protein [Candidatus Palauibacterales bacterium]MDP2528511.1 lysophospholipid acyltransferase family protein [Candidatus Palauibacterales bacterium]MDP2584020.1 lysophospholipid acyltransferase family protein [Candidatus Palauibacterales bacterium]
MSGTRAGLEYLGARALEAGFGALPPRAGEAVGVALGRAARVAGLRAGVVRSQIAAAFPDRAAAWVEATAAACYRHFGREAAVLARLSRLDPGRLVARTRGVEAVREALAGGGSPGGGCVIVTGHLGNWELAGALLAGIGLPVMAVAKRQANRRFDRRLRELRRRLGIETVSMARAGHRIPEAVAGGAAVALVADQDAGSRGVFVPYLGREASTFRGPAYLSLRTGAPLMFGFVVREGGGYRVEIEPVPKPGAGQGPAGAAAEVELTRRWVSRLEGAVRRWPGQYFWFHRRWKTRPPGGALTGTESGGPGTQDHRHT